MSEKDFLNSPVLIYGSRKAGTTLLQSLIDSDEIFVLPGEVKFNRVHEHLLSSNPRDDYFTKMQSSSSKLIEMSAGTAAKRERARVHGLSFEQTEERFDIDKYVAAINDSRDSATTLKELLEADVRAHVVSLKSPYEFARWGIKEVGLHPYTTISVFKTMYPDGKIICITRDPRFVTKSIINNWKKRGSRRRLREIVFYFFEAAYVNRASRRLAERHANVLAIEYEHLTTDTEAVMGQISTFLDIKNSETLLQPSNLGRPAVVATSSRQSAKVFVSHENWGVGLSLLERLTVVFASLVLKVAFKYGA